MNNVFRKITFTTIVFIIIAGVLWWGFESENKIKENDGVMNRFGLYLMPNGAEVNILDDDGIVRVQVKINNNLIIKTKADFGKYQRWVVIWEKEVLFVLSSDIGDYIYTKTEGFYKEGFMEDKDYALLPLSVMPFVNSETQKLIQQYH